MDVQTSNEKQGEWGRIVVEDGHEVRGVPAALYTWVPPDSLAPDLPTGFSFFLKGVAGPDGVRGFFIAEHPEDFIAKGFAGGLALLQRMRGLTDGQLYSYRLMWFLFQRVRVTRERFQDRFASDSSLYVRHAGQAGTSQEGILPANVGLDPSCSDSDPWSAQTLLDEGLKEAQRQGIPNPDWAERLSYGLLQAARVDPLWVTDKTQVSGLIRLALYEHIAADKEALAEIRPLVQERVIRAVDGHLQGSQDAFDAWFSGSKNSLVTQIAKQRGGRGQPLERDLVRRALLDLGWESYQYVASCLQAMLGLFRRLVPGPLTEAEEQLFDQMHCPQPHFGGLPLVLLAERLPWLMAILWEVLEKPEDKGLIAVMHRMLAQYSEMAPERRSADRLAKARQAGRSTTGRPAANVSLDDIWGRRDEEDSADAGPVSDDGPSDDRSAPVEDIALIGELAERIRSDNGVRCGCAKPAWDVQAACDDEEEKALFLHSCRRCRKEFTTEVLLKDLKARYGSAP